MSDYIEILGVYFHLWWTNILTFGCVLLGFIAGARSERKFNQAQTKSLETELLVLRSQAAQRSEMDGINSSIALSRRRTDHPAIRIPPPKPLVQGAYLHRMSGYQTYEGDGGMHRSHEPPGTVLGFHCAGNDRWEHIVQPDGLVKAVCYAKNSPDCGYAP